MTDNVNHPQHYNSHPSGIECISVTEHMNFNLGNAVKYIWRAGLKSEDAITDLAKARWYIEREITRLKKEIERGAQEYSAPSASATANLRPRTVVADATLSDAERAP